VTVRCGAYLAEAGGNNRHCLRKNGHKGDHHFAAKPAIENVDDFIKDVLRKGA